MLFFKPEFRNHEGEIINVVDLQNNAVGFISFLYKENQELYIFGQLNDEGEKQNFIDIVSHYIDGLKIAILGNSDKEPNIYLHSGGNPIELDKEKEKSQ
ncbi:hypothetical protein WD019_04730 [Fictibacillus sp. Mic-4]|uniref:hypothetical protein n=1 Tax=Fictibacillus sp. Mic-4 TaxID=3132826 RepID=UPI003CEFB379